MRGGMRVRPVARSGVYTQGASLLPSRVCRAAFIPATSLLLVSPIRLSRNVPRRLEPFTPCWVSHRNLLKARFHPRGTNHRRDNPGRNGSFVPSLRRFNLHRCVDRLSLGTVQVRSLVNGF